MGSEGYRSVQAPAMELGAHAIGSSMDWLQRIRPASRSDEEARQLAQLAHAMVLYFGGRVEREKDALDLMASKFHWGSRTTRRRLQRLADIGVARWWRDVEDHWTKVWQLVYGDDEGDAKPEDASPATA